MKNRLLAFLAVVFLGLGAAQATPIVYQTALSGAAVNPANASPGTGFATVEYDSALHTLLVDVSFSGLVGTTTAAHIHCCVAAPGNVGVATQTPSFLGFPLGVSSGAYNSLFDLTLASSFNAAFITANGGTVASAESALANGLNAGQAYFNIHTTIFPGGEIRGFLTAVPTVPEPATLSLLFLGMVSLIVAKQKRRI